MAESDPFLSSLIAQPASRRVIGAVAAAACLWVAVLWAIATP